MTELKIIAAAAALALGDLERNPTAVRHDDHVAVVADVQHDISICVRAFWPSKFKEIRNKLRVSASEIEEEINQGVFVTSDIAGEYDADTYFSARERLVVRSMSNEEQSNFRDTFDDIANYMLSQDKTYLPAILGFFRVETSFKLKSKSQHFLITRSVFPRQHHEHIFFLDLKGCPSRAQDDGLFLKDADLTWEHELSFVASEREEIINCLREDIHFLQSLNRTNYSLVVAITKRDLKMFMRLPGQPYGPADDSVPLDNQGTLPMCHDKANGAKAVEANLLPLPKFIDEHPEWCVHHRQISAYHILDMLFSFLSFPLLLIT